MAVYRLAVIIKCYSNDEDFLIVRKTPPPELEEEEYKGYVDSNLWDLPSAPLRPLEGELRSELVIEGANTCFEKINFQLFDVDTAVNQVLSQVGLSTVNIGHWVYWNYVEEPEFGPEPFVHTVFIIGRLKSEEKIPGELGKWTSIQSALKLLLDAKLTDDRIGPLVPLGLLSDSSSSRKWKVPPALHFQEYPPGITILPMRSRTGRPFNTTNLVVISPDNVTDEYEELGSIAYGDALLMDPGCCSEFHSELAEVVEALPRKLVVFVTHHHYDHVDGLSVVQKCNPNAILLAHENTINRIGKGNWSRGCTPISGGEEICIGGERLKVILAPIVRYKHRIGDFGQIEHIMLLASLLQGHTDGHVALLHVRKNTLVVGDHCVGQGSAVLDVRSGGNMKDYFQTTYKFLDISPHVLIPMHGRINMWPKRMLCGYLKHRRDRELSILKAIESGAETLFDVVSKAYADVDINLWVPASSNVRIHVDHLAYQEKLPKDFSMQKFQASCGLQFISRLGWMYLKGGIPFRDRKASTVKLLVIIGIAGLAVTCAVRKKKI